MKKRGFFSFILFMCLLIFSFVLVLCVFADYSEDLVVELDKTEAYPSQDVWVTVYYRITFPEEESYEIGSKIIDMKITTSGLVEVIETNDYLLFPLIGDPAVSGRLYEACDVEIHIPDDHGDYGVQEKIYDVTIDNLRDYCNVVKLKVLAVKENLSIEMDKTKASPGDKVSVNVKYTLDAPSDVVLVRPLSSLGVTLDGLDDVTPPLVFPAEVIGGKEVTIATFNIQIPENTAKKRYEIKAFAGPPSLESNPVILDLSGSTQIPSGGIPFYSRWELWAGLTIAGSAIGGGYVAKKWMNKKQKGAVKGSRQLLLSDPINNKGWRVVELNPDGSTKDGTERTLSDEEVEQIQRVTRVIDGSEYDDLEFFDSKSGETVTWRGPDEIISSPPQQAQTPKPKKSDKLDKKKTKKTKPKVPPTKSKKDVKPSITSPAPPHTPPPVVSSNLPQVKIKPKPLKWGEKLEGGIDMVNKSVKGDKHVQKALEQYKGRRIVIDVEGEGSYGIDVESGRLVMKRGVVAKKSDLYVQMSDKEMTGIFGKLKKYQEYQEAYSEYRKHPYVMLEPKKVTKKSIIGELASVVMKKGTFSVLEEDASKKPIRGISMKDINFLMNVFVPKKGPVKPK